MREIKFRGFRTVQKDWIYGNLIVDKNGTKYIVENSLFSADGHHLAYDPTDEPVFINQDTAGQYTGMHDCNGKEIYEGDIVKTNFDDVGVVAMGEHNGVNGSEAFNIGFYIIWDSYDDRSWMRNDLLYFIKKIGVTVIGNRWDDPELLGGDAR